MNTIDELKTRPSTGRRMPLVYADPQTDEPHVYDRNSRPCPGCGQVTSEGESITKLFKTWWHHGCAVTYLRTEGSDEAWMVLGRQLADHPSAFRVRQSRAIIEELLRISSGKLEPTRSESARRHLG